MADPVETLLREYTAKLRAVFRGQLEEDVTAAVRKAISGGDGRAPVGRRASPAAGRGAPGVAKATSRRGSRGGKRTPEQIAKLNEKLLGYISANPGQRSEQISEGTKLSTGDLALPLRKLVADKKIKATGKARGTTYTAVK